ncbi:MAG: plasmid recombination protein [Formosimonas sp.]
MRLELDHSIFRYGSVNQSKGGLLPALRHNKRALPERGHINAAKSHLNYALTAEETPEQANTRANVLFAANDIRPRKNAVVAIEVIFSLPVTRQGQNNSVYFAACSEWVKTAFEGVLLTFDVHLDEAAPHAHALILPVVGGKLEGRRIAGSLKAVHARQRSFYECVGKKHGLGQKVKLTQAEKKRLSDAVLAALKDDPMTRSAVWDDLKDLVRHAPERFAARLGITLQKVRNTSKTMASTMTRPVKTL